MHAANVWGFARNEMQLIMFTYFKPDVPFVAKRIWNDFSLHNVGIECGASFQIGHVQSNVVEVCLHRQLTRKLTG